MGFRTAVGCKACGKTIDKGLDTCPHCGRSQSQPNVLKPISATVVTAEQRRAALQQYIAHYSSDGYRVVSQTDTMAQMIEPKHFSLIFAALWFCFFGIGLLFYIFYYMAKRDSLLFVQVDQFGAVTAT